MTDVRAPDALPGPLAELVGYHDRVRAHLARLDVLSRGSEGRDRDEWLDAIATLARSALDLVNDEGRLHNLDEERSIFPRLRDLHEQKRLAFVHLSLQRFGAVVQVEHVFDLRRPDDFRAPTGSGRGRNRHPSRPPGPPGRA